jgi:hypothetical protein
VDEAERAYVDAVRERLELARFHEEPPPEDAILKERRRQVKLSRFGVVETVIVISSPVTQPDPDQLRTFGEDAVRSAEVGKSRIPLGLGSSLVVYPVVVAKGISDELAQFVQSYVPERWSTVEFPVVVEPATGSFVVGTKTPVWGGAYYRKTRRDAHELLAPVPHL